MHYNACSSSLLQTALRSVVARNNGDSIKMSRALTALACLSMLVAVQRCFAVGHYYEPDVNSPFFNVTDRYYHGGTFEGSVPPADLLAPVNHLMAPHGSFISPHVLLSAHHISGGIISGSTVNVAVPNSFITGSVGPGFTNVPFGVLDAISPPGAAFGTPVDVRLIKLADTTTFNGQTLSLSQINSNYFRIRTDLTVGDIVSLGGFGQTLTGIPQGEQDFGGKLRWGRNRVAYSGIDPMSPGLSTLINNDFSTATAFHVPYEGAIQPGDSGSGLYSRNGWEWNISAVAVGAQGFGYGSTAFALEIQQNDAWIRDNVLALDGIDVASPSPLAKPTPSIAWTGAAGANWGTASNWQEAMSSVNRLPAYTPATADVIIISMAGLGPVIAGEAQLQDLLIGASGGSSTAQVRVNSGGALEAEAIIAGPAAGERGTFRIAGGSVNANVEYAGFRGASGVILHTGGHNAADKLYIGRDTGDVGLGIYQLTAAGDPGAAPSLTSRAVEIGGLPDAVGELYITGGQHAEINVSQEVIVGRRGSGSVVQETGEFNVVGVLKLGAESGATGAYALSGGTLATRDTIVADGGDASFVQSGGSHVANNLTIGPNGNYEILGGTTTAAIVNTVGDLKVSGGQMKASRIDGTVNLSSGTGVIIGTGLADFRDATFLNAASATLSVDEDSLILLSSPSSFGNIVQVGDLPPHVVGAPLHIDSAGFYGAGIIPDPVTLSNGAYLGTSSGGSLEFSRGLQVSSGTASIDATGNVNVYPDSSVTGPSGIRVDAGASLTARGNVFLQDDATTEIRGTLAIAPKPTVPTGDLNFIGQSTSNQVLAFETTSELSLRVVSADPANGVDQIKIEDGVASIGGKLSIDHIEGFIAPLPRTEHSLITANSAGAISGNFSSVHVDGSTVLPQYFDANDQEFAWAVLYAPDGQKVSMRATLVGDTNLDDAVTFADFVTVQNGMNSGLSGLTWQEGDFSGDGLVTFGDFVFLQNNFGATWPPPANGVPEPDTAVLLLLLTAALNRTRRLH
jgi:hypothetical protein